MPFRLPPLYPVLDSFCFPVEAEAREFFLTRVVRELGAAGVRLVQLRMKGAGQDEVVLAAAAMRAAAPAGMRLILNDAVGLVRATGFDGVHLGQDDMSVQAARALLGPKAVIGLSTHTAAQVEAGEQTTADYLATGPVFQTASKADAEAAIGLAGVRAARARTRKPLVAIGGIGLAEARGVLAEGADAVAVIGALFSGEARAVRAAERGEAQADVLRAGEPGGARGPTAERMLAEAARSQTAGELAKDFLKLFR